MMLGSWAPRYSSVRKFGGHSTGCPCLSYSLRGPDISVAAKGLPIWRPSWPAFGRIMYEGQALPDDDTVFCNDSLNWNPASCGSGSYNELYSSGNFYCNRLANADCKLACREQRPHFDGPPADTPGSSPASFLERADGGVFSRAKGWGEEATSNRNP
ncbi:unnamed protein product [Amoebophrya sp. A120]|nr:unnamed protein product [Amoebophrya sp. A120]|eukprot:GSA120T00008871001.1